MISLTYHTSTGMMATLRAIEDVRRDILLTPLSPKQELKLRFETTLSRLFHLALLEGLPIAKGDVTKLLMHPMGTEKKKREQSLIAYRHCLDMIYTEWLVNKNTVTPGTVDMLMTIAKTDEPNITRVEIKQFLNYLQVKQDNPVIQAGLAGLYAWATPLCQKKRDRITMLFFHLFLAKQGLDVRGFLELEELWRKNKETIQRIIALSLTKQDATIWLEHFAELLLHHLEVIREHIKTDRPTSVPATFFNLNERQQQVLSLLENPEEKISNRQVQRLFHISQITSSRDLSKLVSVGLVFSHGKGRSVYYTRV